MTIWICKLCGVACKLTGSDGSSAPGLLALRIYPGILKELAGRVKGKTVAVCGTNGKTTTNNLLYAILNDKSSKTVCNNSGSNMISGVASAYIRRCDVFGRLKADRACLEVDEAYASKIFDSVKPDCMVVTNFFRDQTDRYGGPETAAELLKKAAEKTPDTVLILNGDDPLCAGLRETLKRECRFFGIDEASNAGAGEKREGRLCVSCRHELKYHYYHYGQLGDYYCENCGFKRPAPDFRVFGLDFSSRSEFMINDARISASIKGFYNIYNIAAAYSAASFLGIDLKNINDILSSYKPQLGRMEEFTVRGRPVVLTLTKNQVGFDRALHAMADDKRSKNVVIILNDNAQDGKDISWIDDAGFELMNREAFRRFAVGGIRAEDLRRRMESAGLRPEAELFGKNIKTVIETLSGDGCEVLYVLANYSPLFETRKILQKMQRSG
ncbi:MAG: MurT ligase domain-containing protein [Oscillospiraceae bacterium]|nr:MurT ligase domain-containing protein [Oscillospiraceae bacterium]